VLLLRRDRLRQAVSYHRAITSNVWWQHDHARGVPATYPDVRHILDLHDLLESQERAWRRYFRRSGIEPLTLHYEDVVANPAAAVRAIAAHVGVATDVEPIVHLRRQADSGSDAMVRAVRAALEAGEPTAAAQPLEVVR
jgi:LPS sulfotransferase NodH